MKTQLSPAAFDGAIKDLPSLSPVLVKFSAIVKNPESGADDIVGVLKLDPVLTGKILRLANSAYAGIPSSITSLKNAVVLLGRKRIYSLVLCSGILSGLNKVEAMPFKLKDYWRHSVSVAAISEAISRFLRKYGSIDCDDVFTAGLLHDIGKLVVGTGNPEVMAQAVSRSRELNAAFYKSEETEASHTSAGALLAQHWNFPRVLCDVLKYHHYPSGSVDFRLIVSIVHVADILAHLTGQVTFTDEISPEFDPDAVAIVNLQPERLRTIANEAVLNEKTIESFLNFVDQA
jgi:putative nucleotidyltransferase with HDIG domain